MDAHRVVLTPVLLAAALWSMCPAAVARTFTDSHACREATEALLKGDVDAAVAAVHQDPADRSRAYDDFQKVSGAFAGAFKGKTPRLE